VPESGAETGAKFASNQIGLFLHFCGNPVGGRSRENFATAEPITEANCGWRPPEPARPPADIAGFPSHAFVEEANRAFAHRDNIARTPYYQLEAVGKVRMLVKMPYPTED